MVYFILHLQNIPRKKSLSWSCYFFHEWIIEKIVSYKKCKSLPYYWYGD